VDRPSGDAPPIEASLRPEVQLGQNVIAIAATKPEVKDTWVARALLLPRKLTPEPHFAGRNSLL
jgi:hypothetical protein